MAIVSSSMLPGISQDRTAAGVTRPIKWLVTSSTDSEDPVVVESAPGIPAIGGGHPTVGWLFATSITAEQDTTNRKLWTVTVRFEQRGRWDEQEQDKPNPIDWSPKFRWYTIKSIEGIDVDVVTGYKIQNSVWEDFDPPPNADRSRLGCNVTRYVGTPQIALYDAYVDHVNSDTWRGFPPGVVRVDDIQCSQDKINGYSVWQESWTFVIERGMSMPDGSLSGHRLRIADVGTREFNPDWVTDPDSNDMFVPITYGDGTSVTKPVPLDSGFVADDGQTHWLYFNRYASVPFSVLGLG